MTTLLLIRHGATDALGEVLCGRRPGWRLNEFGRDQVQALARTLCAYPIQAIYTSPLERTVETAEILGEPLRLIPANDDDLNEIRFGEWDGKLFEDLKKDPAWHQFNLAKSITSPPEGETMLEVQIRVAKAITRYRTKYPNGIVAAVSHSDPIRLVISYLLGAPIDLLSRFDIAPASVTTIKFEGDLPIVTGVNWRASSLL